MNRPPNPDKTKTTGPRYWTLGSSVRGGKPKRWALALLSLLRKFPGHGTGRGGGTRVDELNKQSWSPSTEAARVQRTAHLGGTCFTERKHGSSTEGPSEYSAEDRSVMCVRKLPSEPSERISELAPAARQCWRWRFFLPARLGVERSPPASLAS